MKLRTGLSLKQLLEEYKWSPTHEIPESLENVQISIYGEKICKAYFQKEEWIDESIKAFLESDKFYDDLSQAKKDWDERFDQECFNYFLQLECNEDKTIQLAVDMDDKEF
jgi:hypothetical protein